MEEGVMVTTSCVMGKVIYGIYSQIQSHSVVGGWRGLAPRRRIVIIASVSISVDLSTIHTYSPIDL